MSWTRSSQHLVRAAAVAQSSVSSAMATRLPAISRLPQAASSHQGIGQQQQRAAFSQLSSLRRREDDSGNDDPEAKERGGNPDLDSGTSAPTKGALNKAMNEAADKEGGGGGGSGKGKKSSSNSSSSKQASSSGQQQQQQQTQQAQSGNISNGDAPQVAPDAVAENQARGKTGGGSRLGSSSENAPPQPKILNASVPGGDADMHMSAEQKKEVDQHNKEFSQKFDRGQRAEDDKVDKTFWTGSSSSSSSSNGAGKQEEGKAKGKEAEGGGDNTEGKKAGGRDAEGKDDTVDKTFWNEQRVK